MTNLLSRISKLEEVVGRGKLQLLWLEPGEQLPPDAVAATVFIQWSTEKVR